MHTSILGRGVLLLLYINYLRGAMSSSHHPRRRKTNSLLGSGEYVLDIDREILEMEGVSSPAGDGSMVPQQSPLQYTNNNNNKVVEDSKKRKRGRPRKHPVAVETTPVVKRPRGRPRGSGKHQRAAVTPPAHDGMMAPQTIPQTHEVGYTPAVSTGDATPDCSESTPVANHRDILVTPKQEGMGLRSSSGKNRRKGSLPTKTEL